MGPLGLLGSAKFIPGLWLVARYNKVSMIVLKRQVDRVDNDKGLGNSCFWPSSQGPYFALQS